MADLRLYMLTAGTLRCKVHNIKMNQGFDEPYEIPVPWFLIAHPRGNAIIDGGTPVECASDPLSHWGDATKVYWPVLEESQGCVHQVSKALHLRASVSCCSRNSRPPGAVGRFPNAMHSCSDRV